MQRRRSKSTKQTLTIPPSRRILLWIGALILTLQFALIRRTYVVSQPHSRTEDGVIGGYRTSAELPMQRPQFILFGDSITQNGFADGGWAGRLANAYCRKVRFAPAAPTPCVRCVKIVKRSLNPVMNGYKFMSGLTKVVLTYKGMHQEPMIYLSASTPEPI